MKKIRGGVAQSALVFLLVVLMVLLSFTITALVDSLLQIKSGADVLGVFISAVETVGLLASAAIAIKQLADSKQVAHATFIAELNKSFVENVEYGNVYNQLQNCLDGRCSGEQKCQNRTALSPEDKCTCQISKGAISNYLTFFETMYLLLRKKVIDFDVLDDLFAYRFFLAVHSKYIQQQKIQPQPQNFRNIFCLEYEWLRYREHKGKYTEGEQTVYGQMLLKDLVSPEMYQEFIKDCKKK